MSDNTVEKVTSILKEIKNLETKIKALKSFNKEDKDLVIKYMVDKNKNTLGNLELKIWQDKYYLSLRG